MLIKKVNSDTLNLNSNPITPNINRDQGANVRDGDFWGEARGADALGRCPWSWAMAWLRDRQTDRVDWPLTADWVTSEWPRLCDVSCTSFRAQEDDLYSGRGRQTAWAGFSLRRSDRPCTEVEQKLNTDWSAEHAVFTSWIIGTFNLRVATLTYRALHGSAPPYLASSFTCVADMPHRRRLRSASTEQLDVPTCCRSTIGGRAFPVAGKRCGMACQAMLRRPRRCRCSRTGWRHTCSAAATKQFDFNDISFPSHYLPSRTVVLAIVFTV